MCSCNTAKTVLSSLVCCMFYSCVYSNSVFTSVDVFIQGHDHDFVIILS